MQEGYIDVGGIPTHVMCWGKWISDRFDNSDNELIICVSGNPGLIGFYSKFLGKLYESLDVCHGKKIPIWGIGHAGHDDPPRNSEKKVPRLKGNEQLFNLQGQIHHKMRFIEQYVPKHVKIYMIGHSIGAYMNLELLREPEIKKQVKKSYMLFPTIERMAASPNGKLFTRFFPWMTQLAVWIYALFALLPEKVRIFIIFLYFSVFRIEKQFIGTALKYTQPRIVQKVIHLAVDEMEKVVTPDYDLIRKNSKILAFYYGTTDGWTPVEYFNDLTKNVPEVEAQLCKRGIAHAFVLKSSNEMAYLVAEWINGDMDKELAEKKASRKS
ncbi:lipid droplet-associated hydrolase [Culicoides brevitarsis]|uniref:lipid droplet-associated hydrolase n=1 Tax=Culicoides brevitarsis TaxID=469753 RepID=UPI00307C3FF8